jgi:hypothetical protein
MIHMGAFRIGMALGAQEPSLRLRSHLSEVSLFPLTWARGQQRGTGWVGRDLRF